MRPLICRSPACSRSHESLADNFARFTIETRTIAALGLHRQVRIKLAHHSSPYRKGAATANARPFHGKCECGGSEVRIIPADSASCGVRNRSHSGLNKLLASL